MQIRTIEKKKLKLKKYLLFLKGNKFLMNWQIDVQNVSYKARQDN